MGFTVVKRPWRSGPVTCVFSSGLGLTVFRDLPRSCRITPLCGRCQAGAPRSRVAARTNELGADERRRIIGSEEGSLLCWWWGGRWCFPARGWAEWSHKHPFGVSPGVLAGAMTMCPGTGLLSHEIERGLVAGSCRRGERARGLVTPSRSVSVSWRLRGPCWRRCRRVMCLQPGRWRVGGRRG